MRASLDDEGVTHFYRRVHAVVTVATDDDVYPRDALRKLELGAEAVMSEPDHDLRTFGTNSRATSGMSRTSRPSTFFCAVVRGVFG